MVERRRPASISRGMGRPGPERRRVKESVSARRIAGNSVPGATGQRRTQRTGPRPAVRASPPSPRPVACRGPGRPGADRRPELPHVAAGRPTSPPQPWRWPSPVACRAAGRRRSTGPGGRPPGGRRRGRSPVELVALSIDPAGGAGDRVPKLSASRRAEFARVVALRHWKSIPDKTIRRQERFH
jgi:hypothetical protein